MSYLDKLGRKAQEIDRKRKKERQEFDRDQVNERLRKAARLREFSEVWDEAMAYIDWPNCNERDQAIRKAKIIVARWWEDRVERAKFGED